MARRKMELGPVAQAILDGQHDEELAGILAAAQARQKNRFRRGTKIRVEGTGSTTEGKEGVVLKVNTKTITVGLGSIRYDDWDEGKQYPVYADGEWNMSANFLTVI